ncbi:MAG: M20/M25/M40 family metallo-hydrolase [bacterium]|nr:M20/M25/M40 family metallo-hydrolase [bacterium]
MNIDLLKALCSIHAPSGEERPLRDFLIRYFESNEKKFQTKPELIYGDDFQDCLMVKFGEPRTAVFAHMDSIGFTTRYDNQLVPIGGPEVKTGYDLVGEDSLGPIQCKLKVDNDHNIFYDFGRGIDRGTSLTFQCNFRETEDYVQSCYMDNRLGVFTALKMAEKIEDGLLVFSCWEEHGGGTVPFLIKYAYEKFNIRNALISDITWVTEGVHHGKGVAISMRDRNIPRQSFVRKIIEIAESNKIKYQLEVEGAGSSDGREIQTSPYPIDWCFIGAPEDNVHSPDEKVHKGDIQSMIELYRVLLKEL